LFDHQTQDLNVKANLRKIFYAIKFLFVFCIFLFLNLKSNVRSLKLIFLN